MHNEGANVGQYHQPRPTTRSHRLPSSVSNGPVLVVSPRSGAGESLHKSCTRDGGRPVPSVRAQRKLHDRLVQRDEGRPVKGATIRAGEAERLAAPMLERGVDQERQETGILISGSEQGTGHELRTEMRDLGGAMPLGAPSTPKQNGVGEP